MSYKELSEAATGGRGLAIFAQICLLLNLYGTSVSYMVAGGHLTPKVIMAMMNTTSVFVPNTPGQGFWTDETIFKMGMTLVVASPLCFLRSMR